MPTAMSPSSHEASPTLGEMPGIEAWRRLIEKAGKGRDAGHLRSQTRDGIPIEPLYERKRDALPLVGRGARPWGIVQTIDDPDPDRANERARAAIDGGATGLALRFSDDRAPGSAGLSPTPEALRETLRHVDIAAVHLRLESCVNAVGAADLLRSFIVESGLAPERANAAFGLDPLAAATAMGNAPDPKEFAGAFLALRDAKFKGPLAVLEGRHFHEAGAAEAQELAAILGTAAWWLRTLDATGVAPEAALPYLGASVSVDCDVIVSLAKIRALRLLWERLQELCTAPKSALHIHAETSRRMLTRVDVLDNLLRNTLAAFAAGVGGADSISVVPHTAALGITDRNARALARNIQHLLMDEADLHRVADPAAGSGAVEALTEAIAARAWAEFQVIEREGGVVESLLRTGGLQTRIAAASKPASEAT